MHTEQQLKRKNGETFPAGITVTFRKEEEKIANVTSIIRDISERKRSEEALRESEEKYRAIFEQAADSILLVDAQTQGIVEFNDKAYENLGYTREEFKNLKVPDFEAIESTDDVSKHVKMILKKGVDFFETQHRTKGGEIRDIQVSNQVISIGGRELILSIFHDITASKQAEERINHLNLTLRSVRNVNQLITREKDRNKLLKGICNNLVESHSVYNSWVVLLDESQKLVTCAEAGLGKDFSPVLEQLRKGELSACAQKAMKQSAVVVTKDPYSMCPGCPLSRKYSGRGGLATRLEYEGTIYGILCAYVPENITSDKDEVQLFKEVATDIAFALREMELEAEHRLLEEERLRIAKLESVGTLAGGIAHDFNNLLTGIMGNIGLAKRHLKPEDKFIERLNEAEKAAVRARDLTQQLLTFARGGMPVRKLASISELIKETATFALRGSKTGLRLSLPDDLWVLEVDEGQVSQVIHNIVINADEAMPAGGTLHISASNVVIKRLGALPLSRGNYLRIDIKDEGIGISKELLTRIFEPYYTTKQKGSGLGLATAYSIIKNHGGYITAQSRQNTGTTFRIYLPAFEKPAPEREEVKEEMSTTGKGKILVMDDEEIIRDMLSKMLPISGYQVEHTSDGAEAIKKYVEAREAGRPFDAVIMDLTIPGGMGGKEAIKKLLEIDPDAKVIVSSGYATDPIMSEYKDYGFSAIITKPYSVSQMEETLRGILKGKR